MCPEHQHVEQRSPIIFVRGPECLSGQTPRGLETQNEIKITSNIINWCLFWKPMDPKLKLEHSTWHINGQEGNF